MPHPPDKTIKSDHSVGADHFASPKFQSEILPVFALPIPSGFLQDKIAKWCMPDDILFVDEIPLGATGKIDMKRIRADLEGYVLPTGNPGSVCDDKAARSWASLADKKPGLPASLVQ